MRNTPSALRYPLLATAIAAAMFAAACNRQDDRTAGQRVDSAIAKTEQKAEEAKNDMKEGAANARAATGQAADNMADKARNAADTVGSKVQDAAVTASINAELAKDPKLSALKIDVDTKDGRVMLSGKAPDAESRERATRLASAVKGVSSVDNRLEIGG